MKFTKDLCGSKLEILIHDEGEFSDLIQESFEYGKYFEEKYSRFIDNNFLDQLNTKKYCDEIDQDFINIITLAQNISKVSEGYFDISILPLLENKGYGKSQEKIPENIGYKNIEINNNSIQLKNNISIDIGALGKGFIVDKIYHILSKKIHNFVINFGGDIRVKGQKNILLEDPKNQGKYIGSIDINNQCIASSSGNKRIFGESHHLINPKTKNSQNEIIGVYVTHKTCVFADSFSTALFVSPIEIGIKILKKMPGLQAMIIMKDGTIHKSKGFQFTNKISVGK